MEDKEMPEKITGEMPTLHSSPNFVSWAITHFIGELPSVPDQGDRALKIDAFVNRLQEEMGKIEAAKHELPLCITLLNDAIEALKEEAHRLNSLAAGIAEPVLVEFIPLSGCSGEDEGQMLETREENDLEDKKNWMSSAQLWSAGDDHIHSSAQTPLREPQCEKQEGSSQRLISSASDTAPADLRSEGQHQLPKKPRRCWDEELHGLFLDALGKLGGPQVATPKPIRELMLVDRLTTDAVKSHLQHWLQNRSLPNNKDTSPPNPLAVLGYPLTNHEDKYGGSSTMSYSESGSPQDHFQLASNKSLTSISEGDSIEGDDENESQSRRSGTPKPGKDDV